MSLPLSGKVAIVTGSSRSIGASIATHLASQGANVVINYVAGATAAQGVADAINTQGAGKAIVVQADVSTVADNKRLVDETIQQFGRIDFVILNAGVMDLEVLANITEQDYDKHFNTNVKGPLFLTQAAAPHLPVGGRVIFFSTSLVGQSAITPNYLLYVATKGAVEQLCRTLSKELGARGVTVNTVAPGPVNTDMFVIGKTEQQINFIKNLHPQKRLGEPGEIGTVIGFLVSPEASWVNGQTLRVNGGFVV